MAIQKFIRYYIGSIVMVTMSQAMFFTDSKENDYPRIGKRPVGPRPLDHINRWLERDARVGARDSYNKHSQDRSLEDLSSELFSRYRDVVREALGPIGTKTATTPIYQANDDRILLQMLLSYMNRNRSIDL